MILPRLKKYIDFKGISVAAFEKSIGMSNASFGKCLKKDGAIGTDKLENILNTYPDLNVIWLTTGEGDMLLSPDSASSEQIETRPRIPMTVAAGTLTGFADSCYLKDCQRVPLVKALPDYDYTMIVKGDSMEPKFEGGDEIAIRKVNDIIEWGKTYVLDTRDGAVMKRLYDSGEDYRCVSYNKEYPDFTVKKEDVFGVYKVVGLIRI